MIKTKIKKAIALAGIATIAATSSLGGVINTYATQIGTGSVTGDASFDAVINWDDTYTANSASGSVSNIIVTATVLPTLNMTISTWTIDLGTLTPGVASNGSLGIEIGTNAANGVTITARSGSGGLTNTADSNTKIQDNQDAGFDDGVDESYTFTATAGTHDSNTAGYVQSSDYAAAEVNNDTSEYTIYSTNKGEAEDNTNADVAFTVEATTVAETAAWDYQDNITFTVTGNF